MKNIPVQKPAVMDLVMTMGQSFAISTPRNLIKRMDIAYAKRLVVIKGRTETANTVICIRARQMDVIMKW